MKTSMSNKILGLGLMLALMAPMASQAHTVTTSWYGKQWDGRRTASGQVFNHRKLTVAHRTLPMGTRVKITRGPYKVIVRVNDRGPYVLGRSLDVSQAVANRLKITRKGVAQVHMTILPKN